MKRVCLIGPADPDEYLLNGSGWLLSLGYKVVQIVSNHQFSKNPEYSIESFDAVDFEKLNREIDIIVICESLQCTDAYIITLIERLLPLNKTIYNYHRLDSEIQKALQKKAEEKNCKYYFEDSAPLNHEYSDICKLSVPVVFVMSLFDNMKKMDVETSLNFALNKRGYNSGLIASSSQVGFAGMNSFPNSTFSDDKNISYIITSIYERINEYISRCNLDILIIGIPFQYFQPYKEEHISVPLYLLRKICDPDYIVLNVLRNTFEINLIEDVNAFVADEIGKNVDAFCITSVIDDVVTYENTIPARSFFVETESEDISFDGDSLIVMDTDVHMIDTIVDNIEMKLREYSI